MALELSKTTVQGATATYWRITRVTTFLDDPYLSVILSGYLDKGKRDDDCQPITTERFHFKKTITVDDAEVVQYTYDDNLISIAYGLIKQEDGWTNAKDV